MTEQIDPARQAGASNTTTWSGAAADVRTPPFLAHPKDVLDDAAHSVEQKRLILASCCQIGMLFQTHRAGVSSKTARL